MGLGSPTLIKTTDPTYLLAIYKTLPSYLTTLHEILLYSFILSIGARFVNVVPPNEQFEHERHVSRHLECVSKQLWGNAISKHGDSIEDIPVRYIIKSIMFVLYDGNWWVCSSGFLVAFATIKRERKIWRRNSAVCDATGCCLLCAGLSRTAAFAAEENRWCLQRCSGKLTHKYSSWQCYYPSFYANHGIGTMYQFNVNTYCELRIPIIYIHDPNYF